MTLDEIPQWEVLRSVGHILMWLQGGYAMTACGLWGPQGTIAQERPPRVCRACRRMLPRLSAPKDEKVAL